MQLYAALLYCVGLCPATLPAPDELILYASLKECEAHLSGIHVVSNDPKTPYDFREHCARIYVDKSTWHEILPSVFP